MNNSEDIIDPEQILVKYRMDIRYDGQNFYGWQRLKNKASIQGAIEQGITRVFGIRTNVEGAGRTDRGTHASGQVATLRLPEKINEEKVLLSLNEVLNQDIEILNLSRVSQDFHARESALGKRYCYKIWNHPDLPPERDGKVWYIPETLDVNAMKKSCAFFTGKIDFASFAKVPNYNRASTIRTVHSLSLKTEGPQLYFSIIADGFLYKMVRNIVRAIVKVGEGRTRIEELTGIIDAKNRQAAPGTAPASGLYLEEVFYQQSDLARAIEYNR